MSGKSMTERFLAARNENIYLMTPGDIMYGTSCPEGDLFSSVLKECRDAITDYRLFDISAQVELLTEVVSKTEDDSFHVSSNEANDRHSQLDEIITLPFIDEPKIGLHGWVQLNDTHAYAVLPSPINPEATRFYHVQENKGRFVIIIGLTLFISEGRWESAVSTEPIDPEASAHFGSLTPEKRQEQLLETPAASPEAISNIGMIAAFMKHIQAILLANNIALSTERATKTAKTPVGARRKAKKQGRPIPRERVWINLPGLRYKNGNWSAPGIGGGVAWHPVRGHWRTLSSEKYGERKGTRVWVVPHHRGMKSLGTSMTPYRLKNDAA